MRWTILSFVAVALAILGVIVYSSVGLRQVRVEVCVTIRGKTVCRTASGETERQAVQTAHDQACAISTSGMAEEMACLQSQPQSVRVLE